jgi:predicted site-specific integrase-resolvase
MAQDSSIQSRDRSLLIDDAAHLLGVSRRTVYYLYYRIREGRLRTIRARCGSQRVLLSSIEDLLREARGMAAPDASVEAAEAG